MFEGMKVLDAKGSVDKIRKDLPVFFVAGADDPVGEFGKGVQLIFATKVGPGCYWEQALNGGTVLKINQNGVYESYHEYVDVSEI